jgi:hypothetical protein
MEEFQEADVLWPDAAHQRRHPRLPRGPAATTREDGARGAAAAVGARAHPGGGTFDEPALTGTQPLLRQHRRRRRGRRRWHDLPKSLVGRGDGSHRAAARPSGSAERRVASSVCVGHGRTLKGRDLCAVRDAVLHMTGFLSTSPTITDRYIRG